MKAHEVIALGHTKCVCYKLTTEAHNEKKIKETARGMSPAKSGCTDQETGGNVPKKGDRRKDFFF